MIVLLRSVNKILSTVKLAGTVCPKMYPFRKERLCNIHQHGLEEMLGMHVGSESSGIIRVAVR